MKPNGRGRNAKGEAVKVRGNLTTNDGGIAVNWALDGHGILMRAEWDIERYPAQRPPGAGAAAALHARRGHPCGVSAAAPVGGACTGVRGLRGAVAQSAGGSEQAVVTLRGFPERRTP